MVKMIAHFKVPVSLYLACYLTYSTSLYFFGMFILNKLSRLVKSTNTEDILYAGVCTRKSPFMRHSMSLWFSVFVILNNTFPIGPRSNSESYCLNFSCWKWKDLSTVFKQNTIICLFIKNELPAKTIFECVSTKQRQCQHCLTDLALYTNIRRCK